MRLALFTIALFFYAMFASAETPYWCTIKGVVINRDSKTLYLLKGTSEKLENKQVIPIRNHKFEFTFKVQTTEAYQLVFEDESETGGFPVVFFPFKGEVKFKLYPYSKAENDEVNGGKLNVLYTAYRLKRQNAYKLIDAIEVKKDELEKANGYYSPLRDSLYKIVLQDKGTDGLLARTKLRNIQKTDAAYTAKGRILNHREDSVTNQIAQWKHTYISNNIDVASYYLLTKDISNARDNKETLEYIRSAYPKFAVKYPSHPYTTIIGNALDGLKLKPGDKLPELILPDLLEKQHSLSDLVKDKITLIDFWGSWCGPCIANSRTMVAVYNEFKDRGFNIIGIAKEYKDTKALKSALNREKYPWPNLVELDDKNGVWNKFGITNSTGMMLLIDKDGKIILIDPTAEDVKKELTARL